MARKPARLFHLSALPVLFQNLGQHDVTPEDNFSIEYAAGILLITVRKSNGATLILRHLVGPDWYVDLSVFEVATLNIRERELHIYALRDTGRSHNEIARWLGINVSTVSNALRKITSPVGEAPSKTKRKKKPNKE